MRIQILGSGCPKCKMLEQEAQLAMTEAGIEAEIVKVTDINDIMEMGVMMTPALAIDGDVKSVGKVLKKDESIPILKGEKYEWHVRATAIVNLILCMPAREPPIPEPWQIRLQERLCEAVPRI